MNTSDQARILVVDDEPDLRELLSLTLEQMDLTPVTASDLSEAQQRLNSEPIDVVLTDLRLPDGTGLELVNWIQSQAPTVPVAVITAHGNVDSAVKALKSGAFDFVAKPVDLGVLRRLTTRALELRRSPETRPPPALLGESATVFKLRELIARVARSQAPVLIRGESGTGKELVARLIHESGPRSKSAFVPVNCGAIPPDLIESELFGHKKGAFTGATGDHQGLVRAAEGGTLFLDEVSELPEPLQVKLLRLIQERAVRPVGENREMPVDVRFLSATHQNLEERISHGQFREDLYYRLDVITLFVPPLRDRREDIVLLAEHFLQKFSERAGREVPDLSPQAQRQLESHTWPGNVRELENVIERAITLATEPTIGADDIQLRSSGQTPSASQNDIQSLPDMLEQMERETILKALKATGGNRTEAAQRLGVSFRQLRYRIEKLGLDC